MLNLELARIELADLDFHLAYCLQLLFNAHNAQNTSLYEVSKSNHKILRQIDDATKHWHALRK